MTYLQIYLYIGIPFLTLLIGTCGAIQAVAIRNAGLGRDLFHSGIRGVLSDYRDCLIDLKDCFSKLRAS
ncbi:MAG: hypothetical protein ACLPWF_23445 [Bryobacteraceae bacterium]